MEMAHIMGKKGTNFNVLFYFETHRHIGHIVLDVFYLKNYVFYVFQNKIIHRENMFQKITRFQRNCPILGIFHTIFHTPLPYLDSDKTPHHNPKT